MYLKEFFIKKALYYIYKHSKYSNLVFTWWTSLRIIYDLPRLSEDIDLDIVDNNDFDYNVFLKQIKLYFEKNLNKQIQTTIKATSKIITMKIPILFELWLAQKSDSDFLYIKFDINKNNNLFFQTEVTPYMKDNMFFMIKHYDLPTLFAWKLWAIFSRTNKIFKHKYAYKWRDYFDLIWYLQKWVKPNFKRIQFYLKTEQNITIKNNKELLKLLDNKINKITSDWILKDISWLIQDIDYAKQFSYNFKQVFDWLKYKLIDNNS